MSGGHAMTNKRNSLHVEHAETALSAYQTARGTDPEQALEDDVTDLMVDLLLLLAESDRGKASAHILIPAVSRQVLEHYYEERAES